MPTTRRGLPSKRSRIALAMPGLPAREDRELLDATHEGVEEGGLFVVAFAGTGVLEPRARDAGSSDAQGFVDADDGAGQG
jgi:hypothetical protein